MQLVATSVETRRRDRCDAIRAAQVHAALCDRGTSPGIQSLTLGGLTRCAVQHNQDELWAKVTFDPNDPDVRKRLKYLIRRGIPAVRRREVWLALTGWFANPDAAGQKVRSASTLASSAADHHAHSTRINNAISLVTSCPAPCTPIHSLVLRRCNSRYGGPTAVAVAPGVAPHISEATAGVCVAKGLRHHLPAAAVHPGIVQRQHRLLPSTREHWCGLAFAAVALAPRY